jgi:hypothetical protein
MVDDSHFRVQDFSHIKATASLHWSILPTESRISWPQTLPHDEQELNKMFTLTGFGSMQRCSDA